MSRFGNVAAERQPGWMFADKFITFFSRTPPTKYNRRRKRRRGGHFPSLSSFLFFPDCIFVCGLTGRRRRRSLHSIPGVFLPSIFFRIYCNLPGSEAAFIDIYLRKRGRKKKKGKRENFEFRHSSSSSSSSFPLFLRRRRQSNLSKKLGIDRQGRRRRRRKNVYRCPHRRWLRQ